VIDPFNENKIKLKTVVDTSSTIGLKSQADSVHMYDVHYTGYMMNILTVLPFNIDHITTLSTIMTYYYTRRNISMTSGDCTAFVHYV
jgi:hypothetical protein